MMNLQNPPELSIGREGFGGSSCPKDLRTRRKNNIFDPDFFSSHGCHLSNRFIKKFRPGEAHTQNRRGPTFFCLKILENEDYLSFTAACYHMVLLYWYSRLVPP